MLPTIGDDQTVNLSQSGTVSELTDRISSGPSTGSSRAYWITLSASQLLTGVSVTLVSAPLIQWGQPGQLPGGVDSLPALSSWQWSVLSQGRPDTTNWTLNAATDTLSTTVVCVSTQFEVVGTTSPSVSVTVHPQQPTGTRSPALGVTLVGGGPGVPISASDASLVNLSRGIDPALERFSPLAVGTQISWNNATAEPEINFTKYDQTIQFIGASGAQTLVTFPAGTWGDGNLLPSGMPLNSTLQVSFMGGFGNFPTVSAYRSYIGAFVNHSLAVHEPVQYWDIGNEVPLNNSTLVSAYIPLFNAASAVIHASFPSAKVGSDSMTSSRYLPVFAGQARGVGYLSFHFYVANQLCFDASGNYCPPDGSFGDHTDPQIWQNSTSLTQMRWLPPRSSAWEWFNLTGKWLPVMITESNLNAAGGPYSAGGGTDPRQQTTFAAAWLVGTLMGAAAQNLSEFTYFNLFGAAVPPTTDTSAYGGWGFAMAGVNSTAVVRYAPDWALQLWARYMPAGSSGVSVSFSEPGVVQAFAVHQSGTTSVAIANGVNATVRVSVGVAGGNYSVANGSILDGQSYVESFNPQHGTTSLSKSSVTEVAPSNSTGPASVEIHGYGICMLEFRPASGGAPGQNGSGGGGGPGGNGSTGNASGNTTGTGNSTLPGGGPGSGGPGPTPTIPPIHQGKALASDQSAGLQSPETVQWILLGGLAATATAFALFGTAGGRRAARLSTPTPSLRPGPAQRMIIRTRPHGPAKYRSPRNI